MSIFSKQIDIITKSIVELKENNLKAMKRKLSDLIVRNTDIDFGDLENIEGLFFAARQYAEIVSKRQKRENLIDGLLQVYALVEDQQNSNPGHLNHRDDKVHTPRVEQGGEEWDQDSWTLDGVVDHHIEKERGSKKKNRSGSNQLLRRSNISLHEHAVVPRGQLEDRPAEIKNKCLIVHGVLPNVAVEDLGVITKRLGYNYLQVRIEEPDPMRRFLRRAIIDFSKYKAQDLEKAVEFLNNSPEIKQLMEVPESEYHKPNGKITVSGLLLPTKKELPGSPKSIEFFLPEEEIKITMEYLKQVTPEPVVEPQILKESQTESVSHIQKIGNKLMATTSNSNASSHPNSLCTFELGMDSATEMKDKQKKIGLKSKGVRMALMSKNDNYKIVFPHDQPVQIYDKELGKLIAETPNACFMGRMLLNSWNATSRGAKIIDDIVYFLALPEGFAKDERGLSAKNQAARLMKFDLKEVQPQEQVKGEELISIVAVEALPRDVNHPSIPVRVDDFHVDPKSHVITYISDGKLFMSTTNTYLSFSGYSAKYITNIIKVGPRLVVAGWNKQENSIGYFLIDEEELKKAAPPLEQDKPVFAGWKITDYQEVKNEQAQGEPKGPLSQLIWLPFYHDGGSFPMLVGGTTTGRSEE